ncbi:MAG: dTDP-4-dehydrorhamnose reductase [Coriobacteriia bacterium]|nr:dTDP-4-dehydrorhamnose reductase [Coriobacteriia bacterium]MBN2841234.1 dTDP-4-dehydrorhamnose reductase [Coriobacteriia bacterium]
MTSAYLIAGASGMLGSALQRVCAERALRCEAPPEAEFDITDAAAVAGVVGAFAATLGDGERGVLVNAAAYTNVERAEDEPDLAYRVNEHGARILAEAARAAGHGFVHVSTDFVFDGAKLGPYAESDAPNPLSVYGASKLAGERAVAEAYPGALTVRTAWVFGESGVNFPTKILDLARERDTLSVVTDESGSPTYTVDLARGVLGLVDAGATGLYHLAGTGSCSRYELAAEVLRLAGLERRLIPVTADAFPSKAARPANSVLDCSKAAAIGVVMPPWQDALGRFIAEAVAQERLGGGAPTVRDTRVIIVAHDAGELLDAAVASAVEQTGAAQVTIVDSGSHDGAPERVAERHPGITLRRVQNNGFAAANNIVLAETSERFALLLNPDAELRPSALERLRACADDHPQAGIVGPHVENPDGTLQANSFGAFPTLASMIGIRIWRMWQRLRGNRALSPTGFDACTSVDWVTGACMLVRSQAITKVGLLDDGFFLYYEDVDWCHRMHDEGWDVLVEPVARVTHHLGRSDAPSPVVAASYRESLERYCDRYGLWGLKLVSRLGAIVRHPSGG